MGKIYVGIDIAKDRSSAHGIEEGGRSLFELTFDMDGAGFAELLRTIESNGGDLPPFVVPIIIRVSQPPLSLQAS
jgi:hypothetical protein